MITATTSEAKDFPHYQVQPASRENPRVVSAEDVEVFERNNPALRGIGAIMLEHGIWVLAEGSHAGGGEA
ncbi:hypothetical protein ASZ90_010397 [hydrocarbon metagenome]|uniref:Uncharacterized protein n=1 Tax=hydrocarbon metagenome TaxID=938273 RepID=A0A0W8FG78_9ZZZZ